MRPLPQLRQIRLTHSNVACAGCFQGELPHLGLIGISQPARQFALAKSPLAANLDRRNFPAFRPKAQGSGGNPQPLGDRRSSHKGFAIV